ncbi:MAG: HAMP domain-containing histidine kinase [Planctomycetes bacterium]|nr:HAMP domain-containing histidine kinase [Planctomycetota bacterium]
MKTDSFSNQLRWVILLLAAAVILPTVCLLWFMNQAVKNERLAVRQKLIDVYREKTAPLLEHLEQERLQFEQSLQEIEELEPFSFFVEYCFEKEHADGVLIYDSNGQVFFPVPSENTSFIDTDPFEKAWQLEFVDKNYSEAAGEYERAVMTSSIPYVVFQGNMAMVRCYEKAEDVEKAVLVCRELAYPGSHIINEYTSSDMIRARLKLVQLYQKLDPAMFENEAELLLSDLLANAQPKPLPSEVRVFILGELLDLIKQTHLAQQHPGNFAKAEFLQNAESLSLKALAKFQNEPLGDTWQENDLETIDLGEKAYGMLFKVDNKDVVFISQRNSIIRVMTYIAERLSDSTVTVVVFDEQDVPIFKIKKKAADAFLTIRPSEYLDEWKLCFFFHDADVFDEAANKQAAIYTWTGVLVAVLILATGSFAIRSVNHQIKMNRLKNDFIATVTHELKTPLASMRVLVDTLLEKRYDSEATATEYLQLVANENKRLTHLIDSFLTFSRMERNKQVFETAMVSPVEIANIATESLHTKFDSGNVMFNINIQKPLPMIYGDKDGMVTVLVNLLDNAYKYTNSDKQIELKVYEQNGSVCFAVKDNGIGLSIRAQRKIFNRFYQVDSRLSRRSEGCGLGLSIVKFIVDAHKGTIEIESHTGDGSTFTVRLRGCKG